MNDKLVDVLLWIGLSLISAGFFVVHLAAGLIVSGLAMVAVAYLSAAGGAKR